MCLLPFDNLPADTSQPALVKREVSDEIYREQFVRNRKFFGDAGQDKVEGAFVIVVGLGGVGMMRPSSAFHPFGC